MTRDNASLEVSTSAWHAGSLVLIPSQGRHGIFGVTTWLSTLGTVSLVNRRMMLMSVGDIKEPLRTTSALAVTRLLGQGNLRF